MVEMHVAGRQQLRGEVKISGGKNAALALLAAALLPKGESVIADVPDVSDVRVMLRLLRSVGVKCSHQDGTVNVWANDLEDVIPSPDLVDQIRASIYLAGVFLARIGRVRICLPGGCPLGRDVDFHLGAVTQMGAVVHHDQENHCIHAEVPRGRLQGVQIALDPRWRSVGTTVNILLAASLAEGTTVISNASADPDVVNCVQFLRAMGACVEGEGTETIVIEGVSELHGCEFSVVKDRVEAGTFMLAAAITGGNVVLHGAPVSLMHSFMNKLRGTGIKMDVDGATIHLEARGRARAVDITTRPYPGFPTDLQPPFGTLLSVADGVGVITEAIHTHRMEYLHQLQKMGAQIVRNPGENGRLPGTAWVTGVDVLRGTTVEADDLRAGVALVLAGLAAEGETVVRNAEVIDRGYASLERKFSELGAIIHRHEAVEEARHADEGVRSSVVPQPSS